LNSELRSPEDLSGLKVTVMGLGLNGGGLASASFLHDAGALVTVTDMKDDKTLAASIEALGGRKIRFVLGRHDMADFNDADIVIKNPAVRPDSPYLSGARRIETDVSLFLRFCTSPIIAITGSKGKSTTSSAIHYGLERSGLTAFLGGNITRSPLDFLPRAHADTPVVLELSSWQLADMRGMGVLKPKIAVLTSIMSDHMNRYRDMDEYVADKRLIYADQGPEDFTVCNYDDEYGRSFGAETKAGVYWYSEHKLPEALPGGYLHSGSAISDSFAKPGECLVPADVLVPGKHQKKNLLAAALALRLYGVDPERIRQAMASFPGVEHRLEFFLESKGIRFYNDSAATIPQAVEAAVLSFSSPLVLITGGTDKSLDFKLYESFIGVPKRIVLLSGSGTDKLIPVLERKGLEYSGPYSDFSKAIECAIADCQEGDTILLSPGCASFGMFQHEFDRGSQFKEIVRRLMKG
jgi:UDP-N-acetylmuramoylalanine--D-glutamate ligase